MADSEPSTGPVYTATDELRAADSQSPCLRPLGLCELGGSCGACWYSPDHPRFKDARRLAEPGDK